MNRFSEIEEKSNRTTETKGKKEDKKELFSKKLRRRLNNYQNKYYSGRK